MLGVGSKKAGGDPMLSSTTPCTRGNYAVNLESGSAALEDLLSCLQALPLPQPQPWQRRQLHELQHQGSISKGVRVQVNVMEQVHGVDVSWLHRPHKDQPHRRAVHPTTHNVEIDIAPQPSEPEAEVHAERIRKHSNALRQVTSNPSTPSPPTRRASHRPSIAPTQPDDSDGKNSAKPSPLALSRSISEPLRPKGKSSPRRSSSWISSIGNKFSSSDKSSSDKTTEQPQPATPQAPPTTATSTSPQATSSTTQSSFLSNITRKLSTPQAAISSHKAYGKGGICERRVLNVDPNRQRCLVPELEASRLRKVSFCVDVEIAGGPRYSDEEDELERRQSINSVKLKERAEGEALKNPEALEKAKEDLNGSSFAGSIEASLAEKAWISEGLGDDVDDGKGRPKKTDEERRARHEKRRRRAEENGSIPLEISIEDYEQDLSNACAPVTNPYPTTSSSNAPSPPPVRRDRPTSDPVRIYRRCCQLRESPILKRITEQLMSPVCCTPLEPGIVQCLDLKGSRLQLADMVTLGDWLSVVPVKKLLLEDADLNDEGLRCVLAGLLAAKNPEPARRRDLNPKHRAGIKVRRFQERSGQIEKLTLKNNPRITRIGWKHISLFLYMCRSIKAVDLSMIQFPDTLPPNSQTPSSKKTTDAGELFYKCISERLGGSQLEELSISECGLSSVQVRQIVDGAIKCGITRLGLAGNNLDHEGLGHVVHYLHSGVCACLDIGGNDLRDKLGMIADALKIKASAHCWGLSLAGCNLDTASLKALFPVLNALPDFRFIDLSHNQDLCGKDNGTISLLRRHLGQMKNLKRIHLADVGMTPKQAIALADVLAEAPQLAHVSIVENPEISTLASAKDEAGQEEACALYASYMASVRCSSTLMCVDIDVPSSDNSEIVKALAKQVVAYSLRNMERFALTETSTGIPDTSAAVATLAGPHGGEKHLKEIVVPSVLMSLVGHVDGVSENHDSDDPAPDEDYIVGGAGVVKALQYVLGEKANDLRRSVPNTPVSGPQGSRNRPASPYILDEEGLGKAKKMSTNLLNSARKIRYRLQPALVKEEAAGNDLAYRRLVFLDRTLGTMIQRFEEEYPETRVIPPSPRVSASDSFYVRKRSDPLSINTNFSESNKSDDEDNSDDDKHTVLVRNGSEVSLASRALAIEEGNLHRIGSHLRREVVDSPAAGFTPAGELWHMHESEQKRLLALQEKIESISGSELKSMVERGGWKSALAQIGTNAADLRALQEQDPQAWETFVESQLKARINAVRHSDER